MMKKNIKNRIGGHKMANFYVKNDDFELNFLVFLIKICGHLLNRIEKHCSNDFLKWVIMYIMCYH